VLQVDGAEQNAGLRNAIAEVDAALLQELVENALSVDIFAVCDRGEEHG
jgi:hypothetical protein